MAVRLTPLFIGCLIFHAIVVAGDIPCCAQVRVSGGPIQPAIRIVPGGTVASGSALIDVSADSGSVPAGVIQEGVTQSGAEAGAKAAVESPDKTKLELLLAAKFDRTTTAVLKAWSYTEPEKKPDPLPKSAKATIVNSYQSIVMFEIDGDTKFTVDNTLLIKRDDVEIGQATVLSVEGKTLVAKLVTAGSAIESRPPKTEGDLKEQQPVESDLPTEIVASAAAKELLSADLTAAAEPKTVETPTPVALPELNVGEAVFLEVAAEAKKGDEPKEENIPQQVNLFVRNVTLGNWDEVKKFLAGMKPDDADQVYGHILTSLATATPTLPEGVPEAYAQQILAQMQQSGQATPPNFLTPDDILQLSEAAPKPIRISTTTTIRNANPNDPVSGKWSGRLLDSGMPVEIASFNFVVTLNNGKITGSVTAMGESMPISSGSFDPDSGTLTLSMAIDDSNMQISGTVADGRLTGAISADGTSMKFEADLVEPAESAAAAVAIDDTAEKTIVPPNVKLPAGTNFEDLPTEIQQQILQQSGAVAGAAANSSSLNHIAALAQLVRISKEAGHDFTKFIEAIKTGTTHFGPQDPVKCLAAADLFMKSGMIDEVESFLPSLDDETTHANVRALQLWSELAIVQFQNKRVAAWLEKAWQVNQWIVAADDVPETDKEKAMSNLIELAPQVDKALGKTWMSASFTEQPDRGMKILTNLGTKSATMASQAAQISESERLKLLKLQNEAVEDLIARAPGTADQWNQAITLLAWNWLTEADISIRFSRETQRSSFTQVDMYGNYYWVDEDEMMQRYNGNQQPSPVKIGDLLEIAPSAEWRNRITDSMHTQMQKVLANLHMRINEEDKAFPYIEEIALHHPDIARELVHEFLRIWTTNHDPNSEQRQRNPYIYAYGYDQKAESIPLTRSKQERNLRELADWVERIRRLNLDDVDESLLASAFTTCHSSAEVFHMDRLRSVFGDLVSLKPETTAAISQTMRTNLAGQWRAIRLQEEKLTNRREPEVQAAVLGGYQTARELLMESLTAHPDSWQLNLALACLMFDENAYSQSVQKSSEFSHRRDRAFDQFQLAADKYAAVAAGLEEKDQSTEVYDYWFYAGLGACDLGFITDKTLADLRQFPKIREAIAALSGVSADLHMTRFANNLFTRMSPIKPEVKFRYLRGGFEVVGDHPRAWEARNLYTYYRDLVSEISLVAEIDGADEIGRDQTFGVYVSIGHTTEIERESGGFGKYVQNQTGMMYAYNYGRPTEDYRDKFTDSVRQSLEEHFEVLNVTFESPDTMQSRPAAQPGWRVTPYAYLLLKPRGPEVDRIASLKLDLDFLDTSGYVVIPIESPPFPIDATFKKSVLRPVSNVHVIQTLDERQAADGKLIVEITATASGLVPDIDQLIDVNREGFEVVNVDDQGVSPSQFDPGSDKIQILSDRSWSIEYCASDSETPPTEFVFAPSLIPDATFKFQRYVDADLIETGATIGLEKHYGAVGTNYWIWLLPVGILMVFGGAAAFWFRGQKRPEETRRFQMPEDVNPFSVLTLLQSIRERNGISSEQADELQQSIKRIEKFYFSESDRPEKFEGLEELASTWVSRAK